VRINRRADAPEASAEPVEPPAEPQPESGVADPTGTLLPSVVTLQLVGLPVLALLLLVAGAGALAVGTMRRFRPSRSR
jgi:hypothetical protein